MSKDVMQQALKSVQDMCLMWETVCDIRCWEPDHVPAYDVAKKTIAALKEAIKQAGEPVARWNWKQAKLEWLVPYKAEFDMRPMFFSAPTFPNCSCGEPRNLGIVHRKDAPCFHYTTTTSMLLELTPSSIPVEWQTIDTAPHDGTPILGWNEDYGQRETSMEKYQKGSLGYAKWVAGDGPLNYGWRWIEPKSNWGSTWEPTHWMPLPEAPSE